MLIVCSTAGTCGKVIQLKCNKGDSESPCAMFRICHERMFLTGPSPFGMNGSIVVCFYLDHILKVAAGSDTLFVGAGWGKSAQEKEETDEEEDQKTR